jgi:uncharacterized protein (TIGR02453 family)
MLDELAGELGGEVKVFRQHRDVRFSPDKSPYKTRTYGVVWAAPGPLFAQIDREGLFAGTGRYQLDAGQLERFRAAVADHVAGPALERAIETAHAAGVETYGEALKTAPRGFPRDHPRVGLLRHKALFGGRRLMAGADGIARDAALEHARATLAACEPMNAWLAEHVGPAAAEPAGRSRARSRP